MADAYNLMPEYSLMPASEAFARAGAAARKAVEYKEGLAVAHASLAFASFWGDWDWAGADREFKRALELDTAYVAAHHWYATALLALGRPQEALVQITKAQQLEPASASILADKGLVLFSVGQQRQAITLLQQIAAADPSFISPHRYLSYIYLAAGQYAAYLAEWKKAASLFGDKPALTIIEAGEKGLAKGGPQRMLENILAAQMPLFQQGLVSPYMLARTYSLLGNTPAAFPYLRQAIEKREAEAVAIASDPHLANVRRDPAYTEILKLMGSEPLTAERSP